MAAGPATGYRDLEVYRLAHALALDAHRLSLKLPAFEHYETGSQLRRASKSISANLVEGYGRKRYPADFTHFLVVALASCDETAEWLRYVGECHPAFHADAAALLERLDGIGRRLNRLIAAVAPRS